MSRKKKGKGKPARVARPRFVHPRAEIVPAQAEHIVALWPRLRAADVAEIWAASRSEPLDALCRAVKVSSEAWAGLVDGKVVCLFGVAPVSIMGGKGSPWMLGSDLIDRHAVTFLRRCRGVVSRWRTVYPTLENVVDARNVVAHRWLRWLGFTLGEPRPHGPDMMPFLPFHMKHEVA